MPSENKSEGSKLLLQSAYQGYNKASRFCRSNNIRIKVDIDFDLLKFDAIKEDDKNDNKIEDDTALATSLSNKMSYALIHPRK